ncbi:hypothetical protein JCM8547_008743 [Rhodosporidiobolus lusitaniae]
MGGIECFVCGSALEGDAALLEHHLNRCLDAQRSSPAAAPSNGAMTGPPPLARPVQGGTASLPSSSSTQRPTLPLSPGALQFRSDAALALALSNELNTPHTASSSPLPSFNEEEAREKRDRQLALALARAQEAELSSSRPSAAEANGRRDSLAPTVLTTASERESCPCCEARWTDLGGSYCSSRVGSMEELEKVEGKRRTHVQRCLEEKGRLAQELGEEVVYGLEEGEGREGGWGEHVAWAEEGTAAEGGTTTSWTGQGKDAVVGTPGLLPLLYSALSRSNASPHGRTGQAYLATKETEHVATRLRDWGWGCGYKNAQMIFSSLRHLPCYASLFSPTSPSSSLSAPGDRFMPIPTIREFQEITEKAWGAGQDPVGRSHFNGHLVGSRRWIGTTEVYTVLVWMGVNVKMVDFPKMPAGGEGTHQALVRWITNYFSSPAQTPSSSASTSSTPSTSPPRNAFSVLQSSGGSSIHLTRKQPLYLQHRGHSRTVVGIEIGKSVEGKGKGGKKGGKADGEGREVEKWLLVFDPGKPIPENLKRAASSLSSSLSPSSPPSPSSAPPLKRLKSTSPPVERSGFGLKGKGPKMYEEWSYGDVLKVFRVNMGQLKRREEYQILYVDPALPLSHAQKLALRHPKSRVAPSGRK